jgi:FKBP-type peptidyl-prolyl cis-trans isomerase FklB
MNAKVFINYRRDDTAPYVGRLCDHLIAHFGKDQVFIDIDRIELGEDFVEAINRTVGTCDIAIVAIGPNWLHATDPSGKRRLDDEADFVRMEIVAALQRNIRVIPVLFGRAQMPRSQDLPEALAPLSRRNAIELSEPRFRDDVNRLIEAIKRFLAVAEKQAEAEAPTLTEEERQAAQLAELKLAEEKKAAEAEAARLADEKRKREEAARAEAEKRKAAEAAERARLANEQRRRQDTPYSEAVRTQQGSVATPKDSTTPVELAQTTPATPPVPSISWIAALKKPKIWTREHWVLVGALVLLLLLLAGLGIKKAVQHNRTLVANLKSPSTPAENQLGVSNQAEKKPTPAVNVTSQQSSSAPPQPRATEPESARTAERPAKTQGATFMAQHNQKDKVSYSIGMQIASNLIRQKVELNPDVLGAGVKEALAGKPRLTPDQVKDIMAQFEKDTEQKQKGAGEKNKSEGAKFLEENKKKPGVKTTASGLQYKVEKEGTGAQPKATDMVTVNYRGTLIDGTEFDSSYKRGQPATFPVNGVIKGWTEALQLMKQGSKYQLFIPSNLAYGERAMGPDIGPNSTLIFEVELQDVKPPPTPSPTKK